MLYVPSHNAKKVRITNKDQDNQIFKKYFYSTLEMAK